MVSKYKYSNLSDKNKPGKRGKDSKTVGDAEFKNAKNSRYAYDKSGTSSSTTGSGKEKWSNMTTHSEPARKYRYGKSETASGPKSRGFGYLPKDKK